MRPKYNVEQIRRRKHLRKQYLKENEISEPFLLGSADSVMDEYFPSCKMFYSVHVINNYLVIRAPDSMKSEIKKAFRETKKVSPMFGLDVIVREP